MCNIFDIWFVMLREVKNATEMQKKRFVQCMEKVL